MYSVWEAFFAWKWFKMPQNGSYRGKALQMSSVWEVLFKNISFKYPPENSYW
uniref:Uncharacterized protein n=1 Tax=Anguilla anguilla TaxID=7936 RepID=A0A0E9W660_ANGAN